MKTLFALLIFASSVFGQTAALAPNVDPTFRNSSGTAPLALGFVCTYAAGSTSPTLTYQDSSLSTANQNPIRLNSAGRAVNGSSLVSIYLQPVSYKFVLYGPGTGNTCNGTSVGALIRSIDNVYDLAQFSDNIRQCDHFPGANAGAKIVNCIANLPSTGGTADARGFEGNQTISGDVFSGVTKPLTLLLGDANFSVSTAQTIAATNNWQIIGTGGGGDTAACRGTTITWTGTSGGTVLTLDRVRDSYFEGLCIAPSANIGIGIRIDHVNAPSGSTNSTHDVFNRISIGASTTGVQIGNTSTGNNAEHEFHDVYITGTGSYGYYINHSQSKNIRFYNGAVGNRTYGIYQNNGSFKAIGVVFNANTTDNFLNNANDAVILEACYTEGSGKFLDTRAATGDSFNVSLISNQIQPDGVGGDNIIIRYRFLGPFVMIGNNFGGARYANIKVDVSTVNITSFHSAGNTYVNCTPFSASAGSTAYWSTSDNCMGVGDVGTHMTEAITATPTFSAGMTVSNGVLTASTSISVNSDAPQAHLLSGLYSPSFTNVTNVTSSSLGADTSGGWAYLQVGKSVTISGCLNVTATATGNTTTEVDASLPVLNSVNVDSGGGFWGDHVIGLAGVAGFVGTYGNSNKLRLVGANVTSLASVEYCGAFLYHLQFIAPLCLPRWRKRRRR